MDEQGYRFEKAVMDEQGCRLDKGLLSLKLNHVLRRPAVIDPDGNRTVLAVVSYPKPGPFYDVADVMPEISFGFIEE